MRTLVKSTLLFSLTALTISACTTPGATNGSGIFGGSLSLKSLMTTKITPDRTNVSATIKWNGVGGVEHYELARIENGSGEVSIGPSKITNTTLTYSDSNLNENSSYQYKIYAIDANNKTVASQTTEAIKPINSTDLKSTDILDLKPGITNTITRGTTLKWSSVADTDLYYVDIVNDSTSNQIFGMYTKDTSINIDTMASPQTPSELITQQLPILNGGLAKSVKHKFSVYTIKFNNTDITKATAIGLRQSQEIDIII